MRLKFNAFSGMIPKFNPVVLPDNNAENAVNCRFESGVLQPLYGLTQDATLALTGHNINAIHLWDVNNNAYWLRFAAKVDVIRSPIADDSYSRIYWSGDSRLGGALLYSYTPAVYTGGSEYPINYYKLGIPAPKNKPTATLASAAPTDDVSASARFYTYTYVGKLDEESAPYSPQTNDPSPPAANSFLRSLSVSVPAELAIITANPTVCFADDAEYGTGTRPSYAEDSSKASYSIFSWDYWRQNGAVNLAANVKLRACMQLGRNGTASATWLDDNDLAQNWIVEDFRNTFVSGTMFVASEAVGEAADTVNFASAPGMWRDKTRKLVAKKIQWFSNREAQRVWLIPSWCMMNAYAGFKVNAALSTDSITGTTTHIVSDVVHYGGVLAIQWAESVLGALLYVHETT